MLKKALDFLKKHMGAKTVKSLLVISVFLALLDLSNVVLPVFVGKFIDGIQNGLFILSFPSIILGVYATVFVLQNILMYVYGISHYKAKNKLQSSIVNSIINLNPLDIKSRGEGFFAELMENTINAVMNILTPVSIKKIFLCLQNFAVLALLFFYNAVVGFVCLAVLLFYFIAFLVTNNLFSKVLSEFIKKSSESTSVIFDFIKNNKSLVGNDKNIDFANRKIKKILDMTSKIEFKLQYIYDLIFNFLGNLIQPAVNLFIIGFLGFQVVSGKASFGSLVVCVTYYNMLQKGLLSFQEMSELIFHTNGALETIEEFLDDKKLLKRKSCVCDKTDYFYKFQNVSKKLGEKTILENFSIVMQNGKHYALKGISGAGKSTVINLLLGFEKSDCGEIAFLNDKNNINDVWPLEKIAWFSQEAQIFNLPLYDNIFLGDDFDKAEYESLKALLNLETLENRNLGSNGEHISGGEKQRVMLARFFHELKYKDYFVIDEGFIAVDKALKTKMLEMTFEAVKGKTGLCISHDDEVLSLLTDCEISV